MAEKREGFHPSDPTPGLGQPSQPLLAQQQVVLPTPANPNLQPSQVLTTPQVLVARQQPVIYQIGSRTKIYKDYNSMRSKTLGIVQLVAAALAFIANLIGLFITTTHRKKSYYIDLPVSNSSENVRGRYRWWQNHAYYVGSGFWCTVLIAICGSFAICSAKRKSRGMIVAHLVMAILASVFSLIMLVMACWAVGWDVLVLERGFHFTVRHWLNNDYKNGWDVEHYAEWAAIACKGSMFISVLFAVSSLVSFIACVWGSTLSCNVLCGSKTSTSDTEPNVQYSATNQYAGQGQVIILDSSGRPLPVTMMQSGVVTQAVPIVGTSSSPQQPVDMPGPPTSQGAVPEQPPPYSEK